MFESTTVLNDVAEATSLFVRRRRTSGAKIETRRNFVADRFWIGGGDGEKRVESLGFCDDERPTFRCRRARGSSSTSVVGAVVAKMLRSDPLIMLEQPTEPLAATGLPERERLRVGDIGGLCSPRPDEEFVLAPLVRPLGVVMVEPRIRYAIQILDTEEHEMVQAFAMNRADEAFDERLRVRRLRSAANRLDSQFSQRRIKCFAELAVAVTLNVSDSLAIGSRRPYEDLGLPRNPSSLGMERRGRQDDAPRLDVQECQDQYLLDPLHGQDPSRAIMKARRKSRRGWTLAGEAIVKIDPNQAPLTTTSCRISGVGAHC